MSDALPYTVIITVLKYMNFSGINKNLCVFLSVKKNIFFHLLYICLGFPIWFLYPLVEEWREDGSG